MSNQESLKKSRDRDASPHRPKVSAKSTQKSTFEIPVDKPRLLAIGVTEDGAVFVGLADDTPERRQELGEAADNYDFAWKVTNGVLPGWTAQDSQTLAFNHVHTHLLYLSD